MVPNAHDLVQQQRHLDRMDREAAAIVSAHTTDDMDALAEDLCDLLTNLTADEESLDANATW